jgi:ATP synthase protein I
MQLADRSQAYRVISAQFTVSVLAALLLLPVGWVHAYSGLAGGAIAATANALFALAIFARYRAQEPGSLVARFYVAELLKLVVTGVLFAVAILWLESISIGALLGTFLLVAMVPALVTHFIN